MVTLHAALRHVKRDVGGLLGPEAIHAACEAHGHDWRPGPLDPAATLGLMLRQVAEGNVSGGQVVRMAGGTFTFVTRDEAADCRGVHRARPDERRDGGREASQHGSWRGMAPAVQ